MQGAALAEKIKKRENLVAVFGDGAVEQGVLHECLNFASLHSLPVLFLCEDNDLVFMLNLMKEDLFVLKI